MTHLFDDESGSHFQCQDCTRAVIVDYKKGKITEIIPGNRYAGHSGSTGGLEMSVSINQGEDDPYLDIFKKYFEKRK